MNASHDSELDNLLKAMGEAGKRLAEMGAAEGAAGNISVCFRGPLEPGSDFPVVGEMQLPQRVPELAGATFLVTGSGRRLRELIDEPEANIALIRVEEGGGTGKLFTSQRRRFERVTSEFNSHLAVHYDQLRSSGANFHALIHAQPVHLTYLSHLAKYQDESHLNDRLLRWQPETIMNLPDGIGVVPFRIPGSSELMASTVDALRSHRMVVWAKHGVMARSGTSLEHATDLVEYAETAAKYEYLDMCAGGKGERLSTADIRAICKSYGVKQNVF